MSTLLALVLVAFPPTPADTFGPLFEAVQRQRVFSDGKVFVDAVPRQPPAEVMKAYRAQKPQTREALHDFVVAHFELPAEVDVPTASADRRPLRAHLKALWPVLTRPGFEAQR